MKKSSHLILQCNFNFFSNDHTFSLVIRNSHSNSPTVFPSATSLLSNIYLLHPISLVPTFMQTLYMLALPKNSVLDATQVPSHMMNLNEKSDPFTHLLFKSTLKKALQASPPNTMYVDTSLTRAELNPPSMVNLIWMTSPHAGEKLLMLLK